MLCSLLCRMDSFISVVHIKLVFPVHLFPLNVGEMYMFDSNCSSTIINIKITRYEPNSDIFKAFLQEFVYNHLVSSKSRMTVVFSNVCDVT